VDDVAAAAFELFVGEAPSVVLLTGGRTPQALYERLAGADLPWEDMAFFFSDERCVPDTDPRSNFAMAHRALLSNIDAARYPIDGDTCDADGYEDTLRQELGEQPWFDLALYGLGPDGHTASLFPGRPQVDERDRLVVEVPEAGWEPFVPRVSLTVPALSSARLGVFLVEGPDKRAALSRLLAGEDIPASRMDPRRLVILADREAAEG
jgi:6-phosphogluconolactonase